MTVSIEAGGSIRTLLLFLTFLSAYSCSEGFAQSLLLELPAGQAVLRSDPRTAAAFRAQIGSVTTLRQASRSSGVQALRRKLNQAIVEQRWTEAVQLAESIHAIWSVSGDAHAHALLKDGGMVLELQSANGEFDRACRFGERLVRDVKETIEKDDNGKHHRVWLRAARDWLELVKSMKSAAKQNRNLVVAMSSAIKEAAREDAKLSFDFDVDEVDVQTLEPTETGEREPLKRLHSAVVELVGTNHFRAIELEASLGAETAAEGQLETTSEIAEELKRRDRDTYPDFVAGNQLSLLATLEETQGRFDEAIDAYIRAGQRYGSRWPIDSANAFSAASVLLYDNEDYQHAAEVTALAIEHYLQAHFFHDALLELPWLVSSYQLSGQYDSARDAIERGIELGLAQGDTESIRSLLLEAAWAYESEGDISAMLCAYDDVIMLSEKDNDLEWLTSTLQYKADSSDLLVDNAGSEQCFRRLATLHAESGDHAAAAEAAIEAAKRTGRMRGHDAHIAALRDFQATLGEASGQAILMDQIAALQLGKGIRSLDMQKSSRDAARRIEAGEDADQVLAEVQQIQDSLPSEEQLSRNADDSFRAGAQWAQQQCYDSAAESFFHSALSLNDLASSPQRLSATIANQAKALARSHRFGAAARAYRIASDHADPQSVDHWQSKRSEMMMRLAAHQTRESHSIAASLLKQDPILQQLYAGMPLMAHACELQVRWTMADAAWLEEDFAAAEEQAQACLQPLMKLLDAFHISDRANADDRSKSMRGFVHSLLRTDYVDTRDYLQLGSLDPSTLLTSYPNRAILIYAREFWLAKNELALEGLKEVASSPNVDVAVRQRAQTCLQSLEDRKATFRREGSETVTAGEYLDQARRSRRKPSASPDDYACAGQLAKQALTQWESLPEEQQPFLDMMHAELLVSESTLFASETPDVDQVYRGLEYLERAELRLAATGMRPADLARCGALRFLLESADSLAPVSLDNFEIARTDIRDYLASLFPSEPGTFRLAALLGDSVVTETLNRAEMDYRGSRPLIPLLDWSSPVLLVSQQGSELQRCVVEVSPFANQSAESQLSRAVCLAILQRTAGGQLDTALTADYSRWERLPKYQVRLDVLDAMLRCGPSLFDEVSGAAPFPDQAIAVFPHANDEGNVSFASVSFQPLFSKNLILHVSQDKADWRKFGETLRTWLPISNASQRIGKLAQTVRLSAGESPRFLKAAFSPSAQETVLEGTTAILGLQLPKSKSLPQGNVEWLGDLIEVLGR